MCILSGKRPSVTVFPFSENGHSLCSLKEWEVKKVKKGRSCPLIPIAAHDLHYDFELDVITVIAK